MKTFLIISALSFFAWLLFELITSKPIPLERENLFIGGVKCGKTGTATVYLMKWYKSRIHSYLLSFVFHPFSKKKRNPKPYVYSSIPLKLPYFQKSRSLTEKHLLMEELLPTLCTSVFFDEVGQVANQYDYDYDSVKTNIQTFIRFYGHFIKDGFIFTTEQSSDFIAKPIRARFNQAVEVRKFHRCLFFPFGKVQWQSIKITNDVMNTNDISTDTWMKCFFWFPYVRRYDSRCYSDAYSLGFTHDLPPAIWSCKTKAEMKTRYLPDVRRASTRDIFSGVGSEGGRCAAPPPSELSEDIEKLKSLLLLDITDKSRSPTL